MMKHEQTEIYINYCTLERFNTFIYKYFYLSCKFENFLVEIFKSCIDLLYLN